MWRFKVVLIAIALLLFNWSAARTEAQSATSTANGSPHVLGLIPPINATAASTQAGIGGPLTYHQGPVMRDNTVYAIYWIPKHYTVSSRYVSLMNQYFSDVAADSNKQTNVYATDTQYYDTTGSILYLSQFSGSSNYVIDGSSFPSNGCTDSLTQVCLSDAQIRSEMNSIIDASGWPRNSRTIYFLFTPKGVGSCTDASSTVCAFTGYCGYHSSIGSGNTATLYANMPYAASSPGCSNGIASPNGDDADYTIDQVSHEHNEAITNEQGNAWYDDTLVNSNSGDESGDKCRTVYGPQLGATRSGGYNQVINGHYYWLQEEWSNADGGCSPGSTSTTGGSPTLTVNTTADFSSPCSTKSYSLRCAITQANSDGSGDVIAFNIPANASGCVKSGSGKTATAVCTISPTSALPPLTASTTTINGYTQPGAKPNTHALSAGDNASLTIRLDGRLLNNQANGLTVQNGSGELIEGLSITDFNSSGGGTGLLVSQTCGTLVQGNFIGVAPDGVTAAGNNTGVQSYQVGLGSGVGNGCGALTVGGATPSAANVISGNTQQGIFSFQDLGDVLQGNLIGTTAAGNATLGNGTGANFNPLGSLTIGGSTLASGNVISGNLNAGLGIYQGSGQVQNNFIGTTSNGLVALGNGGDGLSVASSGNLTVTQNVVGGNGRGIDLYENSSGVLVANNLVGVNRSSAQIPNQQGIAVSSTSKLANNAVAYNVIYGISIASPDGYPVQVVLTQNSTHDNGRSGIDGGSIAAPTISGATSTGVSGTSCAGCTVEVFKATNDSDDNGIGEGITYVAAATADVSGAWSVGGLSLSSGQYVTATATSPASPGPAESSGYATNVTVS